MATKAKMKILLYHFGEMGVVGGVDTVVLSLAQAFTARGMQTGIIEMAGRARPQRLLAQGIPLWTVAIPSKLTAKRPRSWASFARGTRQFLKIVRDFKPDVVNVHYPLTQAPSVVAAHLLPHRWRLVVTLHNSDIRVEPLADPYFRKWQRRLFERAEAATAVSQSLMDEAVALYPVLKEKARVIHNGLGQVWFEAGHETRQDAEPFVLFVGRFHRQKGVDVLLKAWAEAHTCAKGTVLRLVGEGPEAEKLKALVRELGLEESVRFEGFVSREQLPALYREARFLVLPSRYEGLPVTLLEAGACGAICVATSISGNREIVEDGVTGFLVEPESVEALASGLRRALLLPFEKRRQMSLAARDRIGEQFSEERIVAKYLETFSPAKPAPPPFALPQEQR
jgi:glycosyltransferase involved in cell wall biosynthesis